MSDIDYNTYYAKHCARYCGWLPAIKKYKRQIKKDTLKYFTLCALEAIDVFMFEKEKILFRDNYGTLPDVIICERYKDIATQIISLVRPPLKGAILIGKLEDILTFQDTKDTIGLSPGDYVKDIRIRKLLRIKELHERLKNHFPFDIINFDPYGNLLNPDLGDNKLYRAFKKIFELQQNINSFLFFVTTPIHDIHHDTNDRLKSCFDSNVFKHKEIKDVLIAANKTSIFDEINEKKRIAMCFSKLLVMNAAISNGWDYKHHGIYIYESPSKTKMLNSVVEFYKTEKGPNESLYIKEVVRIIKKMPQYYSHQDSLRNRTVIRHLKKIIEFREKSINAYKLKP